jgi:hypothetical protein
MQVSQYFLWVPHRSRFTLPIDSNSAADEGSDEALRKKFKRLEDELRKANDSNKSLMTEIKSLKRKPTPVSGRSEDDGDDGAPRSDGSGEGTNDPDSDDPNLLFSSRKVSVDYYTTHGTWSTNLC